IVYVNLMLYQQSWKNEYLDYAKKHAVILRQLLEKDEHYDLLSGNAGAAWILLKLYDIAGDNKYLEMAERAVGVLIEKAELQEQGVGWRIEEGTAPMAGMAQGNSGIL
ncbi:type 2 lantipeptide synthetase LanM, partial [Clostridium sp. SL.3.18]|nr:type 2 lantipeptide synthetase LanM [Clostridium sp. SL.3.18]